MEAVLLEISKKKKKKKPKTSFRSNGKNFELFFAILPEPFGFITWHLLPLYDASASHLFNMLWSFLLRRVSILSGSSSTAWHPSLDFIFSMLILAEAPILNCQRYLCHCQVHTSHTASLSSQPAAPSPSEWFHLFTCFILAPETQQTTCQGHLPSSRLLNSLPRAPSFHLWINGCC